MSKRIMSAAILLVIIASLFGILNVFAAGEATLTVGNVSGAIGDSVTVEVMMTNNPGVNAAAFEIDYDDTMLELTAAKVGSAYSSGAMVNYNLPYVTFVRSGNTTDDGVFVTITFTIVGDDGDGVVTIIPESITDYDENDVPVTVVSGKVTVTCPHTNKAEVPAKASDCVTAGNNLYYTCPDCGKILKADGVTETTVEAETLPLTGHTGGTATCEEQAVCTVCSTPYGELAEHTFREVPAKDSDCVTAGNNLYYVCAVCDQAFKADKVTETTVEAETLPLTGHTGGTATCENQAICTVCSTPYGELAAHSLQEVPAKSSDCVTAGNNLYYVCTVCDQAFKADKVTESTVEAETLPLTGHTGGTATCENQAICTVCSTPYGELADHSLTEVAAKASDCVSHGNNLYYTCDTCGKAFKADKVTETTVEAETLPLTGHTGGTATCEKQAVCTVCFTPYGELAEHAMKKTDAKANTHTADGNIEYYTCTACGKLYKDASGTEQIAEADTVIPAAGHSYGKYEKDASGHWQECDCGHSTEKAGHTFGQWTVISDSTEEKTGIQERICSVCGYTESQEIPLKPHTMKKVDAKEATHTADGNIACYVCTGCGKLYEDEAGTKQITNPDSVVIPALGHSYGEYEKDDSGHWQACSCGDSTAKAEHTFGDWETIVEATKLAKGLRKRACSVCGYEEQEEIPVLPCEHENAKLVGKKDATCTAAGYTGDEYCPECEKTIQKGETIKKLAHTYEDGVCTVCGHDQSSPATGDMSAIIPAVMLLCFSGCALLCLTMFQKKRA